jgi:putative ABC transport system substrate-binding protein
VTPVHDPSEVERTIGNFAGEPNSGLIVLPDSFTSVHADLIIALAARFGLAAIYPFRLFAARGGLLYYGINPKDQYSGAASYVDRILRGAKPADLPVQAPTKFELVINLKTAKTLGLDVPLLLQQLADEVIE